MTPRGALIPQTFSPWRRGEWRAVVDFYLHHDIPIYDVIMAVSRALLRPIGLMKVAIYAACLTKPVIKHIPL